MPMTVEQIVEETRQWPEDVAARRSAELDSGKATLVPGDQVSARIRKIVGR